MSKLIEKWTVAYKPQYLLVIFTVRFTVFSFSLPFLKEMRARYLGSACSISDLHFLLAHLQDLPWLVPHQQRFAMVGAITVECAEECNMASTARQNLSACSHSPSHLPILPLGRTIKMVYLKSMSQVLPQILEVQKVIRLLNFSFPLSQILNQIFLCARWSWWRHGSEENSAYINRA